MMKEYLTDTTSYRETEGKRKVVHVISPLRLFAILKLTSF